MKRFLKSQKGIVYFSVLLSMLPILIMGIGIGVYNSAQGTIREATSQMSSQEKDLYNSSFIAYIGTNKKGIDVRSCIGAIISSNTTHIGDHGKFVALTINGTTIGVPGNQNNTDTEVQNCNSQMSSQKTTVNLGKRYTITGMYDTNGLVKEIIVEEE